MNSLMARLDELSESNKRLFYSNTMSRILYYDDKSFDCEINPFMMSKASIPQSPARHCTYEFGKLTIPVKIYIAPPETETLAYSGAYSDFVTCVLKAYPVYQTHDFKKKLARDYAVFALEKIYNHGPLTVKRTKECFYKNCHDPNDLGQLLADYMHINLIVFDNLKINVFSPNSIFRVYVPTIYIYCYGDDYHYMKNELTSVFSNEDSINYRILKLFTLNAIRDTSILSQPIGLSNNSLIKAFEQTNTKMTLIEFFSIV